MIDFLTAFALVFVIEGLIFALFPKRLAWALQQLLAVPPEALRVGGVVSAAVGVLFVWLLRG